MSNLLMAIMLFAGVICAACRESSADTIPLFKILLLETYQIPQNIDSRLYMPAGSITAVLIYTKTGTVIYNVNGESPALYGGFTLRPLNAILLSPEQAIQFLVTTHDDKPQQLTVLYLDEYPFQ